MLRTIIDAFKVPELRNKILFTLGILALYRFGAYVPVPGIPFNEFANAFASSGVSMTMLDLFTGGALSHFSVFSLGIMPYITASIIMQLMQGVIPAVGRWSKEGETGRKKITQVTRFLTLGLGLINAIGYLFLFKSSQYGVVFSSEVPEIVTDIIVVFTLVAGTAFIMWMGELITQRGIGNGMSLIIFTSIISRVPSAIFSSVNLQADMGMGIVITVVIVAIVLLCIPAIIFVERAQRRIPVNYAKRVQGRRMMGGQSTYIPLKVNAAGVIPIIFASSILAIPTTITAFAGGSTSNPSSFLKFLDIFSYERPFYAVLYLILIVFFSYFYIAIQYNPVEMANNLRKNSGVIPGIRPGKPTSDFIGKIISKITLMGAFFLGVMAILPIIVGRIGNINVSLGGTSILILVGVALDTVKSIESQMMMRYYKGFLD